MLKYIFPAVVVACLCGPAIAQVAQFEFINDGQGTEVYVEETPTALEFHSKSSAQTRLTYDFDLNENNLFDDVSYYSENGRACITSRIDESSIRGCGSVKSRAIYNESVFGNTKTGVWIIPRQELSANGRSFRFRVYINDFQSNRNRSGTGIYEFGVGARPLTTATTPKTPTTPSTPAPGQKPVAAPAMAQQPKPRSITPHTRNPSLPDQGNPAVFERYNIGQELEKAVRSGPVSVIMTDGRVLPLQTANTNGCSTGLWSAKQGILDIDWRSTRDFQDIDANRIAVYLPSGQITLATTNAPAIAKTVRQSVDKLWHLCGPMGAAPKKPMSQSERLSALSIFGDRLIAAVKTYRVSVFNANETKIITLSSATSYGCKSTLSGNGQTWALDWNAMDKPEILDDAYIVLRPRPSSGPIKLFISEPKITKEMGMVVDRLWNLCG